MTQQTAEFVQRSFESELLMVLIIGAAVAVGGFLLLEQLRKRIRRRAARRRALRRQTQS